MRTPRNNPIIGRVPEPAGDVHQLALQAVMGLETNPDYVVWNYIRAAIVKHGGITQAARALNMHRRTIQRIIGKKCPPAKPLASASAFHRLKGPVHDEA